MLHVGLEFPVGFGVGVGVEPLDLVISREHVPSLPALSLTYPTTVVLPCSVTLNVDCS